MKSDCTCSIECAQCNAHLGTVINKWIRIHSDFLTPYHQLSTKSWELYDCAFRQVGGWFTECELMPFHCRRCLGLLGAEVRQAPLEKNLAEDQPVFRENLINLRSLHLPSSKLSPKIHSSHNDVKIGAASLMEAENRSSRREMPGPGTIFEFSTFISLDDNEKIENSAANEESRGLPFVSVRERSGRERDMNSANSLKRLAHVHNGDKRSPDQTVLRNREEGRRRRRVGFGKKRRSHRRVVSVDEVDGHGYPVDRLLAVWTERKRRLFLVKWQDGGTSWQPESNILDPTLIDDLHDFSGFKDGVDVLRKRRRRGRVEYRLKFQNYIGVEKDRYWWVGEQMMHPVLRGKYQANMEFDNGSRKRRANLDKNWAKGRHGE